MSTTKMYLIDTSSLLSLARYYHPFDNNQVVAGFIQNQLSIGELVLLPSVHTECSRVSQRLVLNTYSFLTKNNIAECVATPAQHNNLANAWVVSIQKRKLESLEFENQKESYIAGADFQLIAYALENDAIIITEESARSNDNKLFKKIPAICKLEKISCINLVEWLQDHNFSPVFKI